MLEPKIIHETKDLLVLDKPAGLAVHAGTGFKKEKTLVDFIKNRVEADGTDRPGIVHRLDKNTSGVLLVAKNLATKKYLQAQFKTRRVEKKYIALVLGSPKPAEAILDWPIGRDRRNPLKRAVIAAGKPAQTYFRTLEQIGQYSLLEIYPKTGRTHQIRVHMANLGNPVVGDPLYGRKHPGLNRHFLHAEEIQFTNSSGKIEKYTVALPEELKDFLDKLKQ